MNFEESIIYALNNFGKDIIGENRLVNILADLNVYKEEPACKKVLTEITKDGTNRNLFLKPKMASDVEIRQAVFTISKLYGFQQDIIEYVLLSIRNALTPQERMSTQKKQSYEYVGEVDEYGLREVQTNGKCGYINQNNEEILPIIYDSVGSFSEGLAAVEKDGLYGYIDITGKFVIPLSFDLAYGFSSGIAKVKRNGKFGLIDKKGNIILNIKYDSIGYVSNGYIAINLSGKWGFCDTNGVVTIPPQFNKVIKQFSKGLAAVQNGSSMVIIDNQGNIIKYM